jgi:ribosomal protein L18E
MNKKVVVIHSFFGSVEDFKKLFQEKLPEVEMINLVDDSLLQEVIKNQGITPGVIRRVCNYMEEAENLGADCVLNQCSSLGEAHDIGAKLINIPYVKVDQPMAEEAVKLGKNIALVATAISTVGPSSRVIEKMAKKKKKDIQLNKYLVEGAYEALLIEKNREKHNNLVVETVNKAAEENDVVVLAQGSMLHMLPLLKHIKVPVLNYPESGVEQIREVLNL